MHRLMKFPVFIQPYSLRADGYGNREGDTARDISNPCLICGISCLISPITAFLNTLLLFSCLIFTLPKAFQIFKFIDIAFTRCYCFREASIYLQALDPAQLLYVYSGEVLIRPSPTVPELVKQKQCLSFSSPCAMFLRFLHTIRNMSSIPLVICEYSRDTAIRVTSILSPQTSP